VLPPNLIMLTWLISRAFYSKNITKNGGFTITPFNCALLRIFLSTPIYNLIIWSAMGFCLLKTDHFQTETKIVYTNRDIKMSLLIA
jgi:hypothetical protein